LTEVEDEYARQAATPFVTRVVIVVKAGSFFLLLSPAIVVATMLSKER